MKIGVKEKGKDKGSRRGKKRGKREEIEMNHLPNT